MERAALRTAVRTRTMSSGVRMGRVSVDVLGIGGNPIFFERFHARECGLPAEDSACRARR